MAVTSVRGTDAIWVAQNRKIEAIGSENSQVAPNGGSGVTGSPKKRLHGQLGSHFNPKQARLRPVRKVSLNKRNQVTGSWLLAR